MLSRKFFAVSLAAILASGVTAVAAEKYMYKWQSEDGEVHYSERPPQGVEFTRIRVADDKGSAPAKSVTTDTQQTTTDASKPKDSNYQEWRKENCKIAIENLDILRNKGRIAQDDGQGGTRLMTDEEKSANIKKMEEQKAKYCEESTQ